MEVTKKKTRRGFASMDPKRVKAIASMGGRSVPKEKRSFSTNLELAAAAGRKGKKNVNRSKNDVSTT